MAEVTQAVKRDDFKTKKIVCDFGKLNTLKEYRTIIADELKASNMDIGVVALNAGISAGGPYCEFDDE